MSDDSPFVLTTRQQLKETVNIWGFHQRELGTIRGAAAMVETLARFVALRIRIGRSGSPMVDDSVAIAVAMTRSLARRLGHVRALEVTEACIVATGTAMMQSWVPEDRSIPSLGTQVRIIMGDAEQREIYSVDAMRTTDTGVSWDITACRYAQLTKELGSPEVGKVFCAVDQPFIAGVLPDLPFSCDTTIARGDDRCRFRAGDEA